MGLRINDTAPDFTAETSDGTISFHDWMGGSWAILFSHPKDFTPVCTTEFAEVARLTGEFAKRETKVMGVSVDGVEDHGKWKADIEKVAGTGAAFPIVADTDLTVSKLYDMLPAEAYLPDGRTPADTATVRTTYIIGPDKKVKLMLIYPMTVGRDFGEIMRALDSLQLGAREPVATPANWRPGEDVIVATSVSTEDARERYGKVTEIFPYLRTVKQPG